MTDRIRSSRRLVIISAALLAAVAVVLVLGVIPPVRSDTSPRAAPDQAAGAFLVQAAMALLAAITLVFAAATAVARPRSSIAVLHVIGGLVFLLGIVLAGPALAFVDHGPSLRGAILLMFLSGAAEFAAAGLVAVAASRLRSSMPGPAESEDTSAWKTRIAPAAVLGMGAFFLMFLMGEELKIPATVPAADWVGGLVLAVVLGGYSLLLTYMLLRGLPRAGRNLWIVLAMNAVLLLTALVVLFAEADGTAALQMLVITLFTSAGSYGGLTLAARTKKR